jgi:pyrrolysine biosynthesis protein PylC
MLVAIAGGALQGLEMTYLAKKAGFETLLLDSQSDAPATGICDRFVAIDLTDHESLTRALGSVDLVLPATENAHALRSLVEWCVGNQIPLAFDPGAYSVSSSKKASDALFRELGIPAPATWPDCTFPVLAKPDGESGSKEVEVFPDLAALEARFDIIPPPDRVLQAYVTGPSYSIEVVGRPGDYTPLQTTDLEMDRDYDCKRVLAPSTLPSNLKGQFERIAVTLAEAVGLSGIMDVEAILHEGRLKVLEIDARFPSQTPIAVYHSTGINMVERLAMIFLAQGNSNSDLVASRHAKGSVLEHIRVRDGQLDVCGEHMMAEDGPLHLEPNFFGADAALTSRAPGRHDWVATVMIKGANLKDARERRDQVIAEIRNRFGLNIYSDECPRERFRQMQ